MSDENKPHITLKAIEGGRAYINIHRAIISPRAANKLGVKDGDFVEIVAKKRMGIRIAISDIPDDVILLRRAHRYNIKVGSGETVKVIKKDFPCATRIEIASSESGTVVSHRKILRNLLSNYALMPGQIIETTLKEAGLTYDQVTRVFKTIHTNPIKLMILSTEPSGMLVTVSAQTKISFDKKRIVRLPTMAVITYQDIGGLKKEIAKIREMVELPLRFPELFERFGIQPPKGVLLYGPAGTGKTLLAKAVANEANASFFIINGPEILSKYYGESEQRLRKIFEIATRNAPSIIFIDELDAITPKREESIDSADRRMVSQLLTLMDGLRDRGDVIVIGATNAPQIIDPALRRPGRFDRELEIGVPDLQGRKEILQIHTRSMPLAEDVDLDALAIRLNGYVGADIAALCREAAMHAIRRYMEKGVIDLEAESIDPKILNRLKVTQQDFEAALKEVEPSAMREVSFEHRRVRWSDIGGLENIKRELIETIEWPLKYKEIFSKMGHDRMHGILLYGPPGVGKTMLVEALATELEANFIAVNAPELLSKWVGESEKAIRNIFRKARQAAPSIVCIDEIESITIPRGTESFQWEVSILNQLTAEIDGLRRTHDVVVIGITNRPDLIDNTLLRPGRLEKKIYVPPPDVNAREEILKIYISRVSSKEELDLGAIARKTEFYTGADLKRLVDEATLSAIRENIKNPILKQKHLEDALSKVPPSLNENIIKIYESFRNLLAKRLEINLSSYMA